MRGVSNVKSPVKSRVGKQSLTVWLDPKVAKLAKIGAILDDCTIEAFVEKALRAEIDKRNISVHANKLMSS